MFCIGQPAPRLRTHPLSRRIHGDHARMSRLQGLKLGKDAIVLRVVDLWPGFDVVQVGVTSELSPKVLYPALDIPSTPFHGARGNVALCLAQGNSNFGRSAHSTSRPAGSGTAPQTSRIEPAMDRPRDAHRGAHRRAAVGRCVPPVPRGISGHPGGDQHLAT